MNVTRLNAKVAVLEKMPASLLADPVPEAVLRSFARLLQSASESEEMAEDDYLAVAICARRSLSVLRLDTHGDGGLTPVLEELSQSAEAYFRAAKSPEAGQQSALLFGALLSCPDFQDRPRAIAVVNHVVTSGEPRDVAELMQSLGGYQLPLAEESAPHLRDRLVSDEGVYEAVLTDTSDEARPGLLDWLLPLVPERVLSSASTLGLDELEVAKLVRNAFEVTQSKPPAQRSGILSEILRLLPAHMEDLAERQATEVAALLTSPEQPIQQDGLSLMSASKAKLGSTFARTCAREVVSWYVSPALGEKNQPAALAALLQLKEHLTPEERSELLGTLFDRCIRDESRADVVTRAIEAVDDLGATYDERPANFQDIRHKYQHADEAMKKVILDGLSRVRPSDGRRGTKESKEFWKWAQEPDAPSV